MGVSQSFVAGQEQRSLGSRQERGQVSLSTHTALGVLGWGGDERSRGGARGHTEVSRTLAAPRTGLPQVMYP